jgi:Type II restriction endonuclease EcoO109I
MTTERNRARTRTDVGVSRRTRSVGWTPLSPDAARHRPTVNPLLAAFGRGIDNLLVVEEHEAEADLLDDLLAPIPRKAVVPAVEAALGVPRRQADAIVQAFDDYVAQPLEANLKRLRGRDLARRNPLIYTVRGVETVDDWSDRVLADKETSAIEAHIGTFLEQVARIVCGGIKPGNGVDLQLEDEQGVVHLFAIQAAPNTKNAGSRRSDVQSLKRAARPLRANKQRVSMNIAILAGQARTRELASDPSVTVLASDEFWHLVSGVPDFRARLLRASTILAWLVKARSGDEVSRIKREARDLFGDADGRLDVEKLVTLGVTPERPPLTDGLLDI